MTEQELRAGIVAEARSWIGTPYHIRGRIKGAGCDCGSFLISVAVNCGMAADEEMDVYSMDCWAHWKEPTYLRHVMRHTNKVLEMVAFRIPAGCEVKPGSLILTKTSNCKFANHGGIVTAWPRAVHVTLDRGAHETDITGHPLWRQRHRTVEAFDFKGVCNVQRQE